MRFLSLIKFNKPQNAVSRSEAKMLYRILRLVVFVQSHCSA